MIAKYNAKYSPVEMDAMREAVKAMAVQNFTTYADEWEPKAQAIRDLLNVAGVASIDYFGYFAFANELYHVWKHFAGESASTEAATLIGKYVALGLTLSTLEGIRTSVFNIAAPSGP
jgi:hypothetical protein